jgi:signal transduction histidine kinase
VRPDRFLQSTSARLSLAYGAILVVAFSIVGLLVWMTARSSAERMLREEINLEVAAVETELREEGVDAVVAALRAREERPGSFEYLLLDGSGASLTGHVGKLAGPEGWQHLRLTSGIDNAEGPEELLVRNVVLPGDLQLSVGGDLSRAWRIQRSVLGSLAMVCGIAVLVSVVFGFLVTRKALRRMDLLDLTLERVAAGDIQARFPTDIESPTDVERIGARINRMLDRIEGLVADLQRVSRDIAHDLRTPLGQLRQRLEQAAQAEDAASRNTAIDAAQDKVAEMVRTFDALLRLSEIEAGSARSRFRDFDLSALVEKVADAYRPDIEDADHQLELETASGAVVFGDPDLITQAIANLLENALRHTPPGSRIKVAVHAEKTRVRLDVQDNGPGVPMAMRERILEPYTRLDASRSTPGSGLGLSVVAAIARAHELALAVEDAQPGLRVSMVFDRRDRDTAVPA